MEHQTQRPFVWMACGSVLGIYLGDCFKQSFWVALLLVVLCAIAFINYLKWAKGLHVFLLLVSCLFFFFRFYHVEKTNFSQLEGFVEEENVYVVKGEIISFPKIDGNRLSFDCKLHQLESERGMDVLQGERILVFVHLRKKADQEKAELLMRGDSIRVKLRFVRPQPARNPGGFDQQKYLYQRRIHWLGEVDAFEQIEILPRNRWSFVRGIHHMRHQVADQITRIYSSPYDGYIRGLILGERDQLDPQIEEAYAAFGMTHVLSISGLHITIFVSLGFFLLKGLGLSREKASLILIILLPCYVILTGAEPPVVRAGIMTELILIAVILHQWKDVLSFLSLAGMLQLGWDPYLLFTASFQLTFVITAALIVGVPPLVKKGSGMIHWMKQTLVVTLVAQFASFPIVIHFFYEFTFFSWLANLLFVPFLSLLVLPGSILALGVSYFSLDVGSLIAQFTIRVLEWIHLGMKWLAPLYYPVPSWRPPSLIGIFLYSGAVFYLWFSMIQERRHRLFHLFVSLCLFVGVLCWLAFPQKIENETRVTFLDVGQGDCIVIETGQGKTIIIDGGGTPTVAREKWEIRRDPFEVGKNIVVPFLKYRGIRQIDTLVMTHGDADHIGGLKAVISRFPVKQVIRNALPPQSKLESELMTQLTQRKIPIYIASVGMVIPLEHGLSWQFLHPSTEPVVGREDSTNNESVVLLFTLYGHRLLLTGDIEQATEELLLNRWHLPKVDILKVAHHGSKTSTQESWLHQIDPKEAVISVGRRNRYGHPSQLVIRRLQKHHVRIWRTDQHGAITIVFTPDRYRIEPMIQ